MNYSLERETKRQCITAVCRHRLEEPIRGRDIVFSALFVA